MLKVCFESTNRQTNSAEQLRSIFEDIHERKTTVGGSVHLKRTVSHMFCPPDHPPGGLVYPIRKPGRKLDAFTKANTH